MSEPDRASVYIPELIYLEHDGVHPFPSVLPVGTKPPKYETQHGMYGRYTPEAKATFTDEYGGAHHELELDSMRPLPHDDIQESLKTRVFRVS